MLAGLLMLAVLRPAAADWANAVYWREALVVGGLMLLGGNGGVTWAEQFIPSGVAALVVATVPLWIALLDGLRRGMPSGRTWAGLGLGFAGVVLLFLPGDAAYFRGLDAGGLLALVVASVCWSFGSLRSRTAAQPVSKLVAVAMQMVAGGVLRLVMGLILGEGSRLDPGSVSAKSAGALLYLVLFGSCIGFTSYVWLMKAWDPTKVASYAYVNPVVALGLGMLFAGERIDLCTGLAAAIILAAVVWITAAGRRKEPEGRGCQEEAS